MSWYLVVRCKKNHHSPKKYRIRGKRHADIRIDIIITSAHLWSKAS